MILSPNHTSQRRLVGLALFIGILLLTAAGCAGPEPSLSTPSSPLAPAATPGRNWEWATESGPQGVSVWGVGFDEAHPETFLAGFHTFRAASNTAITAPYHLLNRSGQAETHRLFLLIDEKQQPGGMGDDPTAPYTDVTVAPGKEVTVTVTLPPLEPGAHDLIVISMLNPADPVGLNWARYTFLAGGAAAPPPRQSVKLEDTHLPLDSLALAITENTDPSLRELRDWPATRAAPGEMVEYALYAGYTTITDPTANEPQGYPAYRFAILTFLDERQVPTQPDGEFVFYGQVSRGEIGRILGGVRAPDQVGAHNLLILLVENPGVVLGSIVRGPDEPGPATLMPWFIDTEGVTVSVE